MSDVPSAPEGNPAPQQNVRQQKLPTAREILRAMADSGEADSKEDFFAPVLDKWLGPDEPGILDQIEEIRFENAQMQNQILDLVLHDFRMTVDARTKFKWICLALVVIWMAFVICVVSNNSTAFFLDASVLIALLTTSSANVLGLFGVIAVHIFPRKGATLSAELVAALDHRHRQS